MFVLDPSLKPIYAAEDGDQADLATYDAIRAIVDPLATSLQAPDKQAATLSYEKDDVDLPPQASDVAEIAGKIAMISVVPIVSNWDDQVQKPNRVYYHVAVQYAGEDTASDLSKQYLVDGVHFDVTPDTKPDEAAVPVANAAGRFVGWLKWIPQRPGQQLLAETLPASLGLLAVVVLVISLLLFGLARSTKALERARAEALHRATHDPLTGLANRALFNEKLERSPLPLTLLALDLDRFKAVNDTLGHEAGDELLRQVATRLKTLVRDTDLIARLGGDEFMVLISGRIEDGRAQQLAGQIVTALAVPFQLGQDTASIGVSVGIATAVTDERKELVSRADFALYDAKESGRNTFKVFDDLQKAA